MTQNQIVLFFLKYFYLFSKVLGLCPFHYDSTTKLFTTHWYDIVYPILVYFNVSYFYMTNVLNIVSITILSPLIVVAFFYMTMCTTFMVILLQLLNFNVLTSLINDAIKFFVTLNRLNNSNGQIVSLRLFLYKIVLTSGCAQIASVNSCVALCQVIIGKVDYFVIFIVSVAYFLQTIVLNMFYIIVLSGIVQYKRMNVEIRKVIDDMKTLLNENHIRGLNVENNSFQLSERLNFIASLHCKLTQYMMRSNKIFSIQILIVTGNFVGILLIEVQILSISNKKNSTIKFLLVQLFLSYMFIAESYRTHTPVNWPLLFSVIFYCFSVYIEIHSINKVCYEATRLVIISLLFHTKINLMQLFWFKIFGNF